MIKRSDKQPSPKPCPFCGSEARIRDLYDVVDWTDDNEPITERRFVCECAGADCWVSPVTDPFDTEEEAIEAWNRRSEALEQEPKTGHWIMKRRTHNEVKHYTGQDEMGEIHTISVLERYEVDEPYCSECGKRAGDTSQDYCCACGAKMVESEEKE